MSEFLTLRVAQEDDIGALDDLFQRSYSRLLSADYPPSVLIMAVPVIARAQPELVTSGLFYVVEQPDGVIVGAGGWSLHPPGGRPMRPGVGHLRHVATDPEATRRGVGKRLIDHVADVARGRGMTSLHCQSTLTGRSFYEAMGFVTIGEADLILRGGIGFRVLQMVRQL